ncbi:hypothetical protein DSL72_002919 [Monilinia vaccinii-corymbosi]|uniref:Peptide N-acetyl-beta-D-glucosaminyl asparaginase amidase A N-terminal domain-containing protein n=1 Tax=Monilinia vaccinii-corymbosi TaxID=61207 RepID=A0A8A3PE51_9HELO|nr:hypothetical protein DSL72_002919 [Monilinia vaccinii-corymbosi]
MPNDLFPKFWKALYWKLRITRLRSSFQQSPKKSQTAVKGRAILSSATMYLGDSEVFRTSIAEPKRRRIEWEYVRHMSAYMALWKTAQTLIFDLPNQKTVNLTGTYNTTSIVTYSTMSNTQTATSNPGPADIIILISSQMGVNASSP